MAVRPKPTRQTRTLTWNPKAVIGCLSAVLALASAGLDAALENTLG